MAKISSEAVEAVLDQVRPALQFDGGDVNLLEITEDGIVKLEMVGACGGCPMATLTLKAGIERLLFERMPDIVGVEAFSEGQPLGDVESLWEGER